MKQKEAWEIRFDKRFKNLVKFTEHECFKGGFAQFYGYPEDVKRFIRREISTAKKETVERIQRQLFFLDPEEEG